MVPSEPRTFALWRRGNPRALASGPPEPARPGTALAMHSGMESVPSAPLFRAQVRPLSALVSEEQTRQRRRRWVWWLLAASVPVAVWGAWQFFLRPVPIPLEARF